MFTSLVCHKGGTSATLGECPSRERSSSAFDPTLGTRTRQCWFLLPPTSLGPTRVQKTPNGPWKLSTKRKRFITSDPNLRGNYWNKAYWTNTVEKSQTADEYEFRCFYGGRIRPFTLIILIDGDPNITLVDLKKVSYIPHIIRSFENFLFDLFFRKGLQWNLCPLLHSSLFCFVCYFWIVRFLSHSITKKVYSRGEFHQET